MKNNLRESVVICFLLGIKLFLLYNQPVFHNFWLYDDLHILHFITTNTIWSYLTEPETWQKVTKANFTPLLILSYHLDYKLFGLAYQYYYVHQIISIWILSVSIYLLIRIYTPITYSLFGVAFFIMSKPVAAATEIIMFRHYIEGGIFAVISIIFYVLSLRNYNYTKSIIAAFFYFLAILSKEVYILLIILLFFIHENNLSMSISMSLSFMPPVILYFIWRSFMLESLVGGYSGSLIESELISLTYTIFDILLFLYAALFSSHGIYTLSYLVIAGLFILALGRALKEMRYKALSWPFLGIFVIIVPLIPISESLSTESIIDYRLAFAAAVFCSATLAYAAHLLNPGPYIADNAEPVAKIRQRFNCGLIFPFCLAAVVIGHGLTTNSWLNVQRSMETIPLSEEGRFLWNHTGDGTLIRSTPMLGVHYYSKLDHFLYQNKKRRIPHVIASGYGLYSTKISNDDINEKFYSFDHKDGKITDVSPSTIQLRDELLSSKDELPYDIKLEITNGRIDLEMDTYLEGAEFFMLMGYRSGVYCDLFVFTPGPTSLNMNLATGLSSYVRFGLSMNGPDESKKVSLSPEWHIDFSEHKKIHWPY